MMNNINQTSGITGLDQDDLAALNTVIPESMGQQILDLAAKLNPKNTAASEMTREDYMNLGRLMQCALPTWISLWMEMHHTKHEHLFAKFDDLIPDRELWRVLAYQDGARTQAFVQKLVCKSLPQSRYFSLDFDDEPPCWFISISIGLSFEKEMFLDDNWIEVPGQPRERHNLHRLFTTEHAAMSYANGFGKVTVK